MGRSRKATSSKRNRHTGHINAFKQMCIEKGKRFIHQGKMYSWYSHPPTALRGTRMTLVRMS